MTLAERIELACLLEATARKPGNVHPQAAFDDLRYEQFVQAAAASAPHLAEACQTGLGRAVYEAVRATREATGTNVNLGMCLLLAPLAIGAAEGDVWNGARMALAESTVRDTEFVYRAIQLAQPGGMGQAAEHDIRDVPTRALPEVMALAADRDDVARELATGLQRLETDIAPTLQNLCGNHAPRAATALARDGIRSLPILLECWERGIVVTHLKLIADGDTLIRRKCGDSVCRAAARQAARLLEQFHATGELRADELQTFDAWLRADGHRRNPGTSADLIAAALFAVLLG